MKLTPTQVERIGAAAVVAGVTLFSVAAGLVVFGVLLLVYVYFGDDA